MGIRIFETEEPHRRCRKIVQGQDTVPISSVHAANDQWHRISTIPAAVTGAKPSRTPELAAPESFRTDCASFALIAATALSGSAKAARGIARLLTTGWTKTQSRCDPRAALDANAGGPGSGADGKYAGFSVAVLLPGS